MKNHTKLNPNVFLWLAFGTGMLFVAFGVTTGFGWEYLSEETRYISRYSILFAEGDGIWRVDADAVAPWRLLDNASDSRPDAVWSPDGKRIAYAAEGGRTSDIIVMDADGSNATQLTSGGRNYGPTWSPKGKRIAFAQVGENTTQIVVMNADGSNQVQITQDGGWEPDWSPVGAEIVFTRDENIYRMNADGSNLIPLVVDATRKFSPAWSPDGSKIAFWAAGPTRTGIYTINADGSGKTFFHKGYDPTWSPDGERILFANAPQVGPASLYSLNVDGSNLKRLTWAIGVTDDQPDWSPDGKLILFRSTRTNSESIYVLSGVEAKPVTKQRDSEPAATRSGTRIAVTSDFQGNDEIYVMKPDGTDRRRLTNHPANDYSPTWSPDERRIAFVSERSGHPDIYIMDADGGNLLRLTNTLRATEPDWSPDGSKIVFVTDRNEIAAVEVETGEIEQITSWDKEESQPAWSPTGTQIAFFSWRRGVVPGIYVMDADGNNVRRLSGDFVLDTEPAWSPDGSSIAFISNRDAEGPGLYVMDADGGNVRRLANGDQNPAWLVEMIVLPYEAWLPAIFREN